MENNFKKSDALANEEVKELSLTEILQKPHDNLIDFIIAYNKWKSHATKKEIKEYFNHLKLTLNISTNYQEVNEFNYIDLSNILAPIKNHYSRELCVEKVYINSFKKFLKDEEVNISSLDESNSKNPELKIKHIIPFVAIIYDDHIDWSGSCQDLAYCLSNSIGGSAGDILAKIKDKINHKYKETTLTKNINDCNNKKNSILDEPSYYNEVKPFIKTLI